MIEINTYCPECDNGIFLHELPARGVVPCVRCGKGREALGEGKLDAKGGVERCYFCGCDEFYRQKDFNTKLGLWITGLILGAGLVFLLKDRLVVGFGILVGGALLDLALYFGLGDIMICYQCRAIYRGFPIADKVEGFDLKVHDRYVFKKKPTEGDKK